MGEAMSLASAPKTQKVKQPDEVPQIQQVIGEIFVWCVNRQNGMKTTLELSVDSPSLLSSVENLVEVVTQRKIVEFDSALEAVANNLAALNEESQLVGPVEQIRALLGLTLFIANGSFGTTNPAIMCVIDAILRELSGEQESEFYLTNYNVLQRLGNVETTGVIGLKRKEYGLITEEIVDWTPIVQPAVAEHLNTLLPYDPETLYSICDAKELLVDSWFDKFSFHSKLSNLPVNVTLFRLEGENGHSLYLAIKPNRLTGKVSVEYAVEPNTRFEDYGWSEGRITEFVGRYLTEDAFNWKRSQEEMKSF